ncbi:hypothetical protein LLEC1_06553 [Akanthomyces lecanii]|uniref:ABC transporter domain-containing protein n=1 Tax=Cordyceps confragosa TaxID=2714763 RepID=A0A179ILL4_CORDF|nr:hypothetical protein LLEC1_06553 [Akanthomyces lecanii]
MIAAATGNDEAFGPQYGSSFDFTLRFEQSALGILPTGLLVAATPLFFHVCRRRPAYARAGTTLWIKLAAALVLFALEITSLVIYRRIPSLGSDTALAAASMSCVASFTIIVLIIVEHRFTLRPTSLLSLYILLSLLLDVVKSRSFFLRHGMSTLGSISAVAAAVKAILIGVQEIPKTALLIDQKLRQTASKEATSGFWSRSVFAWLNSIFLLGFRQTLHLEDLEPLDPPLSARPLFNQFNPKWAKTVPASANPGLRGNRTLSRLAKAAYMHANYRCATAVRAVLVAAMADKQLRLTRAEAKKSAIATLMTADVEGVEESLPELHDLWGFFLDISFGLFLLYKLIGLAALTVFGPFISLSIEAFTPVIILIAALFWTRFENGFTAQVAFPTLSLISIVQMPLFYLIDTYASIPRLLACMQRIQKYLQLPEWSDKRQHYSGEVLPSAEHHRSDANRDHDKSDRIEIDISRRTDPGITNNEGVEEAVVELKDAWISPAGHPQAILQDINLRISRSRVIALIGPISCGKSTFLQNLIGEGTILHGAVIVAELKWAYCDQSPYLVNATVRENIIGPNSYNEKWYQAVVEACQLLDDLAQLAAGDETVVGSDGMNLSVGQRHRVALARAVYIQADIMVLDDIFGSQDQITARAMIKKLLGPDGLLRQLKTTVVFASHLGIALDVADEVLQINHTSILHYKELDDDAMKACLVDAMGLTKQMSEEFKTMESPSASRQDSKQEACAEAKSEIEVAEDLIRTRGEFGLYRFYFGSFAKLRFFLWIASMLVVVFCDNFPSTLFYLRILPESGERLHQLLLDASMNATYQFLCTVDSGSLLNRFSQDMSLVVQILPIAMYRFVFMLYSSVISVGFVMSGSSYATIALPIIVAAVYFVQKFYLRTSRQLRHLDLESKTPLFIRFKETANGLQHIRAFGWVSSQLEKNLALLDASQRAYYHMLCVQRWLNLVLDLMVTAVAVFIVSVALYVRSSSSPAAMGLAYLTLIDFGGTLTIAVKRWTEMEIALGSIARSRSFVEDTPREEDGPGCSVPKDWPKHGKIEFKNVTAGYKSATDIYDTRSLFANLFSSADSVLKDVTFTALSGDKVTISGRSGSSLLVTLLNFLEYSGSIYIDGVNINQVPRQALRERITTITQTPAILDDSIRHNLIPFVDTNFPDSIIKSTLRQLGLWEAIQSKGGLGKDIQDAGLSVAQQQLLCIARALLHHVQTESKIVLFDEATASLSMATTLEVQRILVDAFQGCTVLSIAHWDSPIQKPDLQLEIVNGKLVSSIRTDVEVEDEEAAEKRLEEMERCMKNIDRLRLKEDAEQRQILERERALEAKMSETALKSRYTTAQMLMGTALDTSAGSAGQEAFPGRLTSRIPATLLDGRSMPVGGFGEAFGARIYQPALQSGPNSSQGLQHPISATPDASAIAQRAAACPVSPPSPTSTAGAVDMSCRDETCASSPEEQRGSE